MSDEDEKSGSIASARPEEEALRLKTLAEQKYSSSNLKSALKYAKRAHKLHPSLDGLPEMLTAFKILRTAAAPVFEISSATPNSTPDYYKILQVERFSHINTIKRQYKKLALTLHPDKNPFVASAEAFKLVGEAARVLSDKIRRKEYDMKLRIAMQSKAAEEVGFGAEGAAETFWTACSTCRLLHQFERKYLGRNLLCPRCKKSFKAMEVEEDTNNGGDVEKSEGVGASQTRVSARIRERVAKCGNLGVKRKISSVGDVLERLEMKMARNTGGDDGCMLLKDLKPKRVEKVEKSGGRDGGGIDGFRLKKVEKLVNGDNKALKNGEVEIVESERTKRAKAREEEAMTLSQMRVLAKKKKKKKQVQGKLVIEEKEVNGDKLKAKEEEVENEKGNEVEKKEMVQPMLKMYKRRVSKDKNVEIEKGDGKEKENEVEYKREKRERRRVSKYGDFEVESIKPSKYHADLEIKRLITKKNGNLEIMPVEDSDFHDFDKDRRERNFKKGQVWAVYDDDDGMPRQYALVDQIVSINPFEVTLSWLQFQSNGDEELVNWQKHVSCGSFKVSRKVSIKYLNLFSHVVDCERAARKAYRIYPTKGSVWGLYRNNAPNDNRCYDIVLSLSSYSDMYGLSVAHLEKVPGFRTVFRRSEIGANAVVCLGKNDVFKLFSHQIPAKKLCGDEALGLPKDCWELDPASLNPQLLIGM
ncbi:hypothetical protein DH2020_049252 [Rehmannia glutinosa]|uniref:J domain-containing protein n=1 Tax=Rehmannia glutinosa TaxID=99300 RepID=A0ABR0U3C5_REHGL